MPLRNVVTEDNSVFWNFSDNSLLNNTQLDHEIVHVKTISGQIPIIGLNLKKHFNYGHYFLHLLLYFYVGLLENR